MTKRTSKSKPGRPPCDVSEQVIAFVVSERAKGKTLTAIGRAGLTVYDAQENIRRKMKGKHLEANFRQAMEDRQMPWERDCAYKLSQPTFMGRPLPIPIGIAQPPRKAGRPKKNRSH